MNRIFGWLLGIENVTSVDDIDVALAAPWVQTNQFWLFLGMAGLFLAAIVFYRRYQANGTLRARTWLGVARGALLAILLLSLAAPVLRLTLTSVQPPTLFVVFDGTDSMEIEDPWTSDQRESLLKAVEGNRTNSGRESSHRSRIDFLRALLEQDRDNVFERLQQLQGTRLEAFVFDGQTTSHLRRMSSEGSTSLSARAEWSRQLSTSGQVSALGAALDDVRRQAGAVNLAGVLLFSDFSHNAGISPVGDGANSPARNLGVPIHTIGLGAVETSDLSVELQADVKMKKAERSTIVAKFRQTGLTGLQSQVKLVARRMGSDESARPGAETVIGEANVVLNSPLETAEFSFTPQESGLFEFVATVEPLEGETVQDNNRTSRQINIIDDYLRLLYVAYEPEWEWRFVKEVFHRDKLVGMDGFRTFLGSSDPRVRESNVLFLETLTPKRADFFANDVLFLGDVPESLLTDRFGELVREFVGNLGGGLVVLAGPRFGPRELKGSPLEEMLPVLLDSNARLRDQRPFRLQRTAQASVFPFMRLGDSDTESEKAWNNLSELPWYQPVAARHEQAIVLAEHPVDKCADGRTPQPLIAVRQYGKGEVVYLGFNEIWRLRRKYGEQYYRQFWSQLIYRLGMSHALGNAKRFVPRLDRAIYRVEDRVTLSVEAYDENYEPMLPENLPGGNITAELVSPSRDGAAPVTTSLAVPLLRQGQFETRFPVYAPGEYLVRVKDPVTGRSEERRFEVTDSSAERRRPVRDLALQQEIARQSGGRSYDLTTVANLPRDLRVEPLVEKNIRSHSLWTTPLWFVIVVGLMLGEWIARKAMYLQ